MRSGYKNYKKGKCAAVMGKGAGDMNDNNKLQERETERGDDSSNDAVGDRHGACL
jgi:hypothetical protein